MKTKQLHTLMTLGTQQNYCIFNNTVLYKGLYFLFSVATVCKENPLLNLKEGQVVLTSPIINNQVEENSYKLYTIIEIESERGLFLPIISWALEFTKQMLDTVGTGYVDRTNGIVEKILLKIWEYEEVIQSENGLKVDFLNSTSRKSIISNRVHWDNYDSLIQAEILLKNQVIDLDDLYVPHVHDENIGFFCDSGLCDTVILDL